MPAYFYEKYKNSSGGHGERETPVPIPNTEVKPFSVDGTALVTGRESRTLPGIKIPPLRGNFVIG
jgi:hypothetical protein